MEAADEAPQFAGPNGETSDGVSGHQGGMVPHQDQTSPRYLSACIVPLMADN